MVGDYGPSVLVTVAIDDASQFRERRPGTSVVAKINCGRTRLGYAWFHDFVEKIHRALIF